MRKKADDRGLSLGTNKERHILCISGGKDSTALAVYLKAKIPSLEYVFCDTGKELAETYEYLNKIEAILGIEVTRLQAEHSFDHYLEKRSGFIPSPQMRWCTETLKIVPFEKHCGDDTVYSYIGLRADENRKGYISHKPNIIPRYPFREDGINKAGVLQILKESGLGLPDYYEWRSRSGCYFCFYQRKVEWIGLKNRHPELFELAKKYEKAATPTGRRYTWSAKESLDEIADREDEIVKEYKKAQEQSAKRMPNRSLIEVYDDALDELDEQGPGCIVCEL